MTTQPTYQEETAELYFRQGASDKVYRCQLTQAETGWTVSAQWGRRNSTLSADTKIDRADYSEAKKVFDRTVCAKVSKGYQGTAAPSSQELSSVPAPQAAAPPKTNSRGPVSHEIVFQPELLTRCTGLEAHIFAGDPRYIFQVKQDGDRLAIVKNGTAIYGYNKLGQVVRLDSTLFAAVRDLCEAAHIDQLLMDGEWESSGWYGWDILRCDVDCDGDLRSAPYEDRLLILANLLQHAASDLLHITRTATSTAEKRALLADRNLEGVAIKLRCAAFRPGRNGQHKKFKFEQTASFLIGPKPAAKSRDGHRSAALYIHDPAAQFHTAWQPQGHAGFRFVATVKIADRYEVPAEGSIVEVRYLYAYPAGGIAQPCYFGKVRADVRPQDCSTAQLKFKASADDDE